MMSHGGLEHKVSYGTPEVTSGYFFKVWTIYACLCSVSCGYVATATVDAFGVCSQIRRCFVNLHRK